MTNFLTDDTSYDFLTSAPQEVQAVPGEVRQEEREQDQEVITQTELPSMGIPVDIFSAYLEEEKSLEDLNALAFKQGEIDKTLRDVESFSAVDAALAKDPQVAGELYKQQHRIDTARLRAMDIIEKNAGGTIDAVFEFIDEFAYDVVAGIRDIPQGFKGEGTEMTTISTMWANAIRSMDDEEFQSFVEERFSTLETRADTLISSDMAWVYYRELSAMEAAGFVLWDEGMGYIQSTLGTIDVATLGLGAVTKLGKVGRSLIGRLRSTTGTTVATDAALGTEIVLRGGLDGDILDPILRVENGTNKINGATSPGPDGPFPRKRTRARPGVEDAEIIEDIAPGVYQSSVQPSARTSPPVSQATIGRAWTENSFITPFVARASRFGMGASDISASAKTWATEMAKRTADASATRVIDTKVVEEGLQNFLAEFILGKTGGKAFKSVNTAKEVATKIPGATVVNLRTGKAVRATDSLGEYAVKVQTRVPTQELVDPLDTASLHKGFGAMFPNVFGRAGRGSSSYMSNLADAADFGGVAYRKDIEKLIKNLKKNLKGGEQANIDNILTSLRDTPVKGNARSWLTSTEFTDAYKTMTGNYPTKRVLQAYEDTVQMSDFSYFILANERLRGLANQRAMMFKSTDESVSVLTFPSTESAGELKADAHGFLKWVWDAAQNKRMALSNVADDAPIMKFEVAQKDGSEWVINFDGRLRVPELEDAYPYNPGGPRSNPDITYFVGNADGHWNTLIGARSERDAAKAVDEYNSVANRLNNMGLDLDAIDLSKAQRAELDDLVRTNNSWNPDIETVDEFLEFAKTRGISPKESVELRNRGVKVNKFVKVADKDLMDLSLEKYMMLRRQDNALVEYGGELASNPDPVFSITQQFNRMVDKGAKTQYSMEHPTAWVKAAERASKGGKGVSIEGVAGPTTDANKVRNWVIGGNSDAARALKKEQAIILRRLDLYKGSSSDFSSRFWDPLSEAGAKTVELLHNTHPKLGGIAAVVNRKMAQAPQMGLSLGFMQRMAEPSQLFLQSTHIIPVALMSNNGAAAISLASVIRQAARTGDSSAWNTIYKGIQKMTGLDDVEAKALMDHLFDSGRGYMRGAIAEDPGAAGILKGPVGTAADFARIPYYAGENYAATVSRIAAYLDIRVKHPTLNVDSSGFWHAVQQRDRDLSFALNNAQKSSVQSGPISSVVTQWSSYPLRTLGNIAYGGETLTAAERVRLAAGTTIMWGIGGMGLQKMWPDLGQTDNEALNAVINNGIDVVFDATLGVKVGERVAFNPIELIERAVGTVQDPFETIPAFNLGGATASSALGAISHFASGRHSASSHELERLVRAWKIIDSPVMAYTMMMEDVRRTRTGSTIEGPFTGSQEFFQAVGISPSEAIDIQRMSGIVFNQKTRQANAIDKALPIFNQALVEAERGNYEGATNLILDADAVIAGYGMSDTYLAKAREEVFRKSKFDRVNYLLMELVQQGRIELSREFEESLND